MLYCLFVGDVTVFAEVVDDGAVFGCCILIVLVFGVDLLVGCCVLSGSLCVLSSSFFFFSVAANHVHSPFSLHDPPPS